METSSKSEIGDRKSDAILQLRPFDRGADYGLICTWYRGHGKTPPPLAILPKLGIVICETDGLTSRDLGALWLYLDNSCGVCFVDKVVSAPGQQLGETRRALEFGLEFLRQEAVRLGYGVMTIYAYPATARFIRKIGFTECATDMSCLWRFTQNQPEEN